MITRHLQLPPGGLVTDSQVRCQRCLRLLAEQATRPWRITCSRCGHTNLGDPRGAAYAAAPPQAPTEPEQAPKKPKPKPMPPAHRPRRKRRSTAGAQATN